MSDPPRLSTMHRDGLTAAMLDSARDDDPPGASRQRSLVAFGVGAGSILTAGLAEGGAGLSAGAAASGASVAGAAKVATWVAVAKWAGGGAVVAVLAAAAVDQVTPRSSVARLDAPSIAAPAAAPAPAPEKMTPPATRPAPIDPVAAAQPPSPVEVPSLAVREAPPPARASVPRGAPQAETVVEPAVVESGRVASAAPADLAAEVGALDRASAAIRSGDIDQGIRLLDEYRRAFPAGVLAPESQVLRIEALVKKGDRAGAVRLGEAFLSRSPQSALAGRVRSLLLSVQKEQAP